MAKKFSARYSNNDELSSMVTTMKRARKASGYSQDQFGKLIGISRETVVHIEGLVECTVLSLECEVLKRWYSACANKISEYERESLQSAITDYLFSSVFIQMDTDQSVSNSQTADSTPQNTQQQQVA